MNFFKVNSFVRKIDYDLNNLQMISNDKSLIN